ncbi:MAG: tryptophan synthase subunit alpha [Mariprofundus sp.]
MSIRLSKVFERCKQETRAAMVGYLTAGDPDVSTSRGLLLALAEQTDILEIGMPFSDPMADGPVILAASERALEAGAHIDDVFTLTRSVRKSHPDLGIVLMGYANVPYAMGFETFAEKAHSAGADAVLIVDIPPEEGHICDAALKKHDLDRILLLSPTSTDERIRLASENGSGFIYYVSLTGITGADMGDIDLIRNKVAHIQDMTDMPVCVGFGVKTPEQAAQVAQFADGVVVGSHFVSCISDSETGASMRASLSDSSAHMRQAVTTTGARA